MYMFKRWPAPSRSNSFSMYDNTLCTTTQYLRQQKSSCGMSGQLCLILCRINRRLQKAGRPGRCCAISTCPASTSALLSQGSSGVGATPRMRSNQGNSLPWHRRSNCAILHFILIAQVASLRSRGRRRCGSECGCAQRPGQGSLAQHLESTIQDICSCLQSCPLICRAAGAAAAVAAATAGVQSGLGKADGRRLWCPKTSPAFFNRGHCCAEPRWQRRRGGGDGGRAQRPGRGGRPGGRAAAPARCLQAALERGRHHPGAWHLVSDLLNG